MQQTPAHVSLLQKLMRYFEFAASIGMLIPEHHIAQISGLVDALLLDLQPKEPALNVTTGQTNQPEGFAAPIPPTDLAKEEPVTPPVQVTPPAGTHETVGIPSTS